MKKLLAAGIMFTPVFAFAELTGIVNTVDSIQQIVNTAVPIVFTLALLAFFYGVARYILAAGDEGAAAKGRSIMIGGIIGMFCIAAVWGIVAFIGQQFGIDTNTQNQVVPRAI